MIGSSDMHAATTRAGPRRSAAAVIALGVALATSVADAQSEGDVPPVASTPASPTTLLPREPPCALEAFYERAVHVLAAGQYEEAEDLLERVVSVCPRHPYAAELLRFARLEDDYIDAHGLPFRPGDPAARPGLFATASTLRELERREASARYELVVLQASFGGVHGAALCTTFILAAAGGFNGCSIPGGLGAFVAGAVLEGGVSFFASWSGVKPGQTQAVDAGSFWGSWNGLMVGLLASQGAPFGSGPFQLGLAFHGGLLAGTAGGVLVAAVAPPREGQVSFMNSGGLWGGTIGFLLSLASAGNTGLSTTQFTVGQLVGVNVGLTAAGLASAFYPTSRWRMAVVDLVTLLGFTIGAGVGVLVGISSTNATTIIALAGAGGTALGFGVGLGVTHAMDHPSHAEGPAPIRTSFLPMSPDGRLGMTLGATF